MSSKIRQTEGQAGFPESSFKYGPLMQVRTLYAAFVQGLFMAAPPGYRWRPAAEETEMIVTDENPIQVDVVGKRPAISFTRGPVQSYNFGLDDMLEYSLETGTKKKSILIPGTMNINCCSRVDLESENIAWVVAEQLWMHRELLMHAGFFEIGRQFVVGAPSPAGSIVAGDSADEWYVTTVSSPFQIYRTSQISPLGKDIVGHIDFSFTSRLGPFSNAKGPLGQEGANLPYNVRSKYPNGPNHLQPHPLDPTQMVTVRSHRPYRQGLRPPSINGRTIPILEADVEQSDAPVTVVTSKVKV